MENKQNSRIGRIIIMGAGPIGIATKMAIDHVTQQGHTVEIVNPSEVGKVFKVKELPIVPLQMVEEALPTPISVKKEIRFVNKTYQSRSNQHKNKV